MEENIFHLQYAMDTFYFLVCGALVMWMAAGFAMLEAGLVRAKNTTEILTKNVTLYAVACIMYMVCGYAFMYGGDFFLSGIASVDVDETLKGFAEREDGLPVVLSIPEHQTSSSRWCLWQRLCPLCQARSLSV